MLGGGIDDTMIAHGSSIYLDDNGAYPKRLRTSLSKIMDKQLDYNNSMANVIPIGPRSRSRSNSIGGDTNPTPISSMLRSTSPIRISPIPGPVKVQPPKMYKKEYLLKNNNSNQVIKNVPIVGTKMNANGNDNLNRGSNGKPALGHRRGMSSTSQLSNTTKYVELEPPKIGDRFPSSDSYTSSSPTVTLDLELQMLADEEVQNGLNDNNGAVNNKRNSILSNFMNDEQLWLNNKDDFQYPDDHHFDKERLDLTIKKLQLKIAELKLDNDKLHLDNENLKDINNSLTRANESLTFQSSSLLQHIQQLPRISNTDFIIHNSDRSRENISNKPPFKSDALVKIAVEGKIKELEKELAKCRRIQKALESRLSPRKNRVKYLTVEQLDALAESKSESKPDESSLHISDPDNTTAHNSTTTLDCDEGEVLSGSINPTRLQHGFNLRIQLTSLEESKHKKDFS